MKSIIKMLVLFLAVLGLVGGIGYTLFFSLYVIAIGIGVLGGLAFKSFKELFKSL